MIGMIDSIRKDWRVKVLLVLFIVLSVWWVLSPQVIQEPYDEFHFQFTHIYFIVPLFGALCALASLRVHSWRSVVGKVQLFLGLGLMGQVLGQISYSYQVLVHSNLVPIYTLGDWMYITSILFYFLAVIYIATVAEVKSWLASLENKIHAAVIIIVMLVLSYGLFVQGYDFNWSVPMWVIFDFVYFFIQSAYMSVALLCCFAMSGAKKEIRTAVIIIVFALVFEFLSDYTFIYEASINAWKINGVVDYMLMLSYTLMSLGVIRFGTIIRV